MSKKQNYNTQLDSTILSHSLFIKNDQYVFIYGAYAEKVYYIKNKEINILQDVNNVMHTSVQFPYIIFFENNCQIKCLDLNIFTLIKSDIKEWWDDHGTYRFAVKDGCLQRYWEAQCKQ